MYYYEGSHIFERQGDLLEGIITISGGKYFDNTEIKISENIKKLLKTSLKTEKSEIKLNF